MDKTSKDPIKISLRGHSGCKLEIEENKHGFFVIKTSKDLPYNQRLIQQAEKQRSFKHPAFLVPQVVVAKHNDDGLFSFSMEYVSGTNLSDYFRNVEISVIDTLVQKFVDMIPESYEFDPYAKDIFYKKIEELENRVKRNEAKNLKHIFIVLKKYEWNHCIVSQCHGDLTLENIIWKNGNLYLIDFLDSFYESWMIDFAKILQDVECFWSYRHHTVMEENLKIRLLLLKNSLLDKVVSLHEGPNLVKAIYYILLLNLVRIIPYTNDTLTKDYLMVEINRINKLIATL